MIRIDNCLERLKEIDAPRNHHLKGQGEINICGTFYDFKGKVCFDSSIPAIGDRDHVNKGDSIYAIWNTVHLIANEVNRSNALFGKDLNVRSRGKILPDKEYDIYTKLSGFKSIDGKDSGIYECVISLEGKKLFEESGLAFWKKK